MMLLKAVISKLPHNATIPPCMVCRLIRLTMLWTRFIEHRFQVERSFSLVKILPEVPVALSTVVSGAGVRHQL
jgi:hypothetical protein